MNTSPSPTLPPDVLFNAYVGAMVAHAYGQIGLFAALEPLCRRTPAQIATEITVDLPRLQALLHVGTALGYLHVHPDGSVQFSPAGEELRCQIGYFTWAVGGYGKLLHALGPLCRDNQPWEPLRDSGMVAMGTAQSNGLATQSILDDVLDALTFSTLADIGCGSAARLIHCCLRYPAVRGIGIDISAEAITLARRQVEEHGLGGRIQLIHADVADLLRADKPYPMFADVDLVTSFMMLHDLHNVPALRGDLFERLQALFPRAGHFAIADTVRMPDVRDCLPIFNLAFELVHAYMDLTIPAQATYEEAFERAGLHIAERRDFGTPHTYLWLATTLRHAAAIQPVTTPD